MPMTDQEVLATFMEQKPTTKRYRRKQGWWKMLCGKWVPCELTFEALWKIQDRLTNEQWCMYLLALSYKDGAAIPVGWLIGYIHVTAEQKMRALAAVLRPVVEGES